MARWLVTFLILAAISVGGYYYAHQRAGDAIKSEMLKVADDIGFTAEDRAAVNGFIADAHGEAFRHALDATRAHGRKFDEQLYFNEIFDDIIRSIPFGGDGACCGDARAGESRHLLYGDGRVGPGGQTALLQTRG